MNWVSATCSAKEIEKAVLSLKTYNSSKNWEFELRFKLLGWTGRIKSRVKFDSL